MEEFPLLGDDDLSSGMSSLALAIRAQVAISGIMQDSGAAANLFQMPRLVRDYIDHITAPGFAPDPDMADPRELVNTLEACMMPLAMRARNQARAALMPDIDKLPLTQEQFDNADLLMSALLKNAFIRINSHQMALMQGVPFEARAEADAQVALISTDFDKLKSFVRQRLHPAVSAPVLDRAVIMMAEGIERLMPPELRYTPAQLASVLGVEEAYLHTRKPEADDRSQSQIALGVQALKEAGALVPFTLPGELPDLRGPTAQVVNGNHALLNMIGRMLLSKAQELGMDDDIMRTDLTQLSLHTLLLARDLVNHRHVRRASGLEGTATIMDHSIAANGPVLDQFPSMVKSHMVATVLPPLATVQKQRVANLMYGFIADSLAIERDSVYDLRLRTNLADIIELGAAHDITRPSPTPKS